MEPNAQDQWAQWLLHRRHGGDPERHKKVLRALVPVRDKVLGYAKIDAGETVLDVGAGDGLIAFGALPLVGEQGKVLFSDISQDLLDHSRELARQMDVADRCEFLRASADDLSAIPDGSVDVVTTRSVLIYVDAKPQAFREFFRVLAPGGRLSLFEPVNRSEGSEPAHLFWGYDVTEIQEIAGKVRAVYERIQPPGGDPMNNFDERDLMAYADAAGFAHVHLELQSNLVRQKRLDPYSYRGDWASFLRAVDNPRVPSLEEAIRQVLTSEEAERFTACLRPQVETELKAHRNIEAYLSALKSIFPKRALRAKPAPDPALVQRHHDILASVLSTKQLDPTAFTPEISARWSEPEAQVALSWAASQGPLTAFTYLMRWKEATPPRCLYRATLGEKTVIYPTFDVNEEGKIAGFGWENEDE